MGNSSGRTCGFSISGENSTKNKNNSTWFDFSIDPETPTRPRYGLLNTSFPEASKLTRCIAIDMGSERFRAVASIGIRRTSPVPVESIPFGTRLYLEAIVGIRRIGSRFRFLFGKEGVELHDDSIKLSYFHRLLSERTRQKLGYNSTKSLPIDIAKGPDDQVLFRLGSDRVILLQEAYAILLRFIIDTTVSHMDTWKLSSGPVVSLAMPVPDGFTAVERLMLEEICHIAGVHALLVNSSIAAVLGYRHDNNYEDGDRFLVHDFGASKLTVSAIKIVNDCPEIVYTRTRFDIAGDLIDQRLVDFAVEELGKASPKCNSAVCRHTPNLYGLFERMQEAKYQLSEGTADKNVSVTVYLNVRIDDDEVFEHSLELSRKKFNELNKDIFLEAIRTVGEVLRGARDKTRKNWKKKTKVLCVGGCIYIPRVQKDLRKVVKFSPVETVDTTNLMAIGACLYLNRELLRPNQLIPSYVVKSEHAEDTFVVDVQDTTYQLPINAQNATAPLELQLQDQNEVIATIPAESHSITFDCSSIPLDAENWKFNGFKPLTDGRLIELQKLTLLRISSWHGELRASSMLTVGAATVELIEELSSKVLNADDLATAFAKINEVGIHWPGEEKVFRVQNLASIKTLVQAYMQFIRQLQDLPLENPFSGITFSLAGQFSSIKDILRRCIVSAVAFRAKDNRNEEDSPVPMERANSLSAVSNGAAEMKKYDRIDNVPPEAIFAPTKSLL